VNVDANDLILAREFNPVESVDGTESLLDDGCPGTVFFDETVGREGLLCAEKLRDFGEVRQLKSLRKV